MTDTTVCRCGHRLLDHALVRDRLVAGTPYRWRHCLVLGCGCESAVTAAETAAEVTLPATANVAVLAASTLRRRLGGWRTGQVVWGLTECQRPRCGRTADLLYDGLPLCLDDADDLAERECAVAAEPRLRELLPDWGEV